MLDPGQRRSTRRRRRRLLFETAISLAIIALAYALALPRIASYSTVWKELRTLSWPWIAGLCAATVLNNVTLAGPLLVVVPRLGLGRAVRLTQVSTAISLAVPGGATVGMAAVFALLRSSGVSRAEAGRAIALTGLWNQSAVIAFPVVAALALVADHRASPLLFTAAAVAGVLSTLIAAAIFLIRARSDVFATLIRVFTDLLAAVRLGRWWPQSWTAENIARFQTETRELMNRRWRALTVATLVNQLNGFLVLYLSVRAIGSSLSTISVAESFAAWSAGRLISSLPTTPGGAGLVELSLTGILIRRGIRFVPPSAVRRVVDTGCCCGRSSCLGRARCRQGLSPVAVRASRLVSRRRCLFRLSRAVAVAGRFPVSAVCGCGREGVALECPRGPLFGLSLRDERHRRDDLRGDEAPAHHLVPGGVVRHEREAGDECACASAGALPEPLRGGVDDPAQTAPVDGQAWPHPASCGG